MKKVIFILFIFLSVSLSAQPPGYYNNALGKNGVQLQSALKNIIDNHAMQSYPLWSAFPSTDNKGGNVLWDMYSDVPGGTSSYTYTLGTDQCGQYNSEGDCYNHEHVWPKTYFNDVLPMNSDLHHIIPTDGWVNNKRANFPLGNASGQGWTGSNGSKTASSNSYSGYTGNVFEPIDEYKGDFARMFFYMSTRYMGEDNSWKNWEMANKAVLTSDAVQLLMQWHSDDTVSQKEIDRNNAIYAIQGNRNPFIDYPIFADCIWGTTDCTPLSTENFLQVQLKVFPNPSEDKLSIEIPKRFQSQSIDVAIYNTLGQLLIRSSELEINIEQLPAGVYSLQVGIDAERNPGHRIQLSFIKK